MHYPFDEFRNEIYGQLRKILSDEDLAKTKLDTPPSYDMGDLALACFPLARQFKKSPDAIAEDIASKVECKGWISRVETVRGYVNFFINYDRLSSKTLDLIRKKGKDYGSFEKKGKKVIIEHTSANPNGPLHVGRARNPIIGDTLVRIYKFYGYDVEAQFYVDDLGKQVAILAWGIKNIDPSKLPPPSRNKPDHELVRFYQEAHRLMEEDETVAEQINEITRLCESGDENAINSVRDAYEKALEGIKESLRRLNIEFDSFIPESKFVRDGSVEEVVEKLKKLEYADHEGDAWYIDMEPFGIKGRDTRFFFTRRDGTTLYATRDIAYHIWKSKQADILINVLGEDHKLEAKQVEIALELLGVKNKPNVVFYAFVNLPEGRMSTRRGRVVYLDDLIDEAVERAYEEVKKRRGQELSEEKIRKIAESVGIGAVRYNIIKIQPEKDIVFKWEDALNFEGNSAPFIQYAHARACSILRKISTEHLDKIDATLLKHKQEVILIKTLARFPDVVRDSCSNNKPHSIPNYLFDLASQFNQFYRDCPVIRAEDKELKKSRLALVDATKTVLENGLKLLGIDALEEM
ncbi:MAG TPA: arginine--tRNA ligase [Thermoplasmatales archaeon]|nr:arginine--tRNA ligase [Thermoplasmatales archaeon]